MKAAEKIEAGKIVNLQYPDVVFADNLEPLREQEIEVQLRTPLGFVGRSLDVVSSDERNDDMLSGRF